jgi:hypothetical protein
MHHQLRLVRNGQVVIVTTDTSADNFPTVTYTTYDIYDTLPFSRQDSYHHMTKYYQYYLLIDVRLYVICTSMLIFSFCWGFQ